MKREPQDPSQSRLSVAVRSSFRWYRWQVFGLTWLAYAVFYVGRSNLSVAKFKLGTETGLSTSDLGMLDTGYLTAYAAGQFVSGWVGDRIGGKRLVVLGLFGSAALNAVFGFGDTLLFFLVPWVLNGLAQSAGWPGCAKAFSQWFAQRERGTTMSLWGTCYQVGAFVAPLAATWLLVRMGWRAAFFGPALVLVAIALLVLLAQKKSPKEEGLPDVETYYDQAVLRDRSGGKEAAAAADAKDGKASAAQNANTDGFLYVLGSRPLWTLGLSYVVIKFVRYTFLFWLPFYMSAQLGYSPGQAGYTSVTFGLAGAFGAVFAGVASDRIFAGRRAPAVVIMMVLLAGATYVYAPLSTMGTVENIFGIALIGFFVYGPDSLTSGVAAVDFGGERAASMAVGFVNGVGSIGGALSGVIIGAYSEAFGWPAVFTLFTPLCILAALMMATMWNMVPPRKAIA